MSTDSNKIDLDFLRGEDRNSLGFTARFKHATYGDGPAYIKISSR